ncbi:kinase-like protein [Aspergillus campestris IBT 28561]|uniref:Kinase-like protein n=1 Tax=Aspergillus campestris (strain IBT 28561) TaxID=1392248 RepID=A0A2I1DBE4_ASPC2|nr:kinase-like protein [Aspergillus campestris IBT 28561]PKY07202.1 kinase-like protein [Aspergillus campestris IBT 28561]
MALLKVLCYPLRCLFPCFKPGWLPLRDSEPDSPTVHIVSDAVPVPPQNGNPTGTGLVPSICDVDNSPRCPSIDAVAENDRSSSILRTAQLALIYARTQCYEDSAQNEFVPISALREVLCDTTVHAIIKDVLHGDTIRADQLTTHIMKDCFLLFAILVDRGMPGEILGFLEEGINDDCLPFTRNSTSQGSQIQTLETRCGTHIRTIASWDMASVKRFETKQYRMLAPIFQYKSHYRLSMSQPPPFIHLEFQDPQHGVSQGSYSEVFQACIHPDHHTLEGELGNHEQGPVVAVKRLFNEQANGFGAERAIFDTLESIGGHPHMVKLLFTYKKGQKFHLVFPWADGTLRTWLQQAPTLLATRQSMLWCLKQMTGIASGLKWMHTVATRGNNHLFGRHGDIKADNILWFRGGDGRSDAEDILKIADLGLARFHTLASRSDIDPSTVRAPSTYSPPDALRRIRVSRAWDLWGLGCMYLEFVTSILCGYEAVDDFAAARGRDDTEIPEISTDYFYTADYNGIRPSVRKWVEGLHRHPRCTGALHDLLNLIMSEMIVVEPWQRSPSARVHDRLAKICDRASHDDAYLMEPAPRLDLRGFLVTEEPSTLSEPSLQQDRADSNPERSPTRRGAALVRTRRTWPIGPTIELPGRVVATGTFY